PLSCCLLAAPAQLLDSGTLSPDPRAASSGWRGIRHDRTASPAVRRATRPAVVPGAFTNERRPRRKRDDRPGRQRARRITGCEWQNPDEAVLARVTSVERG